jgi:anti-sigma factor RsiW
MVLRSVAGGRSVAAISDEQVMAYVDGELCDEDRVRVSDALVNDPSLNEVLAAFQRTRGPVHAAFEGILSEPMPDNFLQMVYRAPDAHLLGPWDNELFVASPPVTRALGLARATAAQSNTRRIAPLAFAASLGILVAGLAGWSLYTYVGETSQRQAVHSDQAGTMASGALFRALETSISGVDVASKNSELLHTHARIVASFRDRDGRICRHYAAIQNQGAHVAGVACRTENGAWIDVAQAPAQPSPAPAGAIIPAEGRPNGAIDAIVDRMIHGDLFSVEYEQNLIRRGWPQRP